jgi:putative peptide zinc metalloprotease protein
MMDKLHQLQGLHERLVVDTSEDRPVYLLAVGTNPTYIRLSPTSYYLLEQRSLGVSFESVAEHLSQRGRSVLPTEVEAAYNKVLEEIAEIERNPKLKQSEFFFRFTLLPKSWVRPLAAFLSFAFSKVSVYCLLGFMGLAVAIAPHNDFNLEVTTDGFFWGYLLFLVSLLIHELGHASACSRYGGEPSDIGFTFYLIWPAFYSDVSAAWRLKRWQRVIVDIGGLFFQSVVAAIYIFIYTFTHWIALKLALLMIVGSCLFTLNPVFKFDGYWFLADALGVTNLAQQPLRISRYFFNKLRKRSVKPLPWPSTILAILSLYTVVSFGIWGYFLWFIFPLFWQEFIKYPELVESILSRLWQWPPILGLEELKSFASSTFLIAIFGLMAWRLLQSLLQLKFRRQTELRGSQ